MRFIIMLLLLLSSVSYGQVYGDLLTDKRKITNQINYTVYANATGEMVFDIVVDRRGNVTSCVLNKEKTNVNSTPTMMTAKNRIMKYLKFEEGYLFPEWHRGEVLINVRPQSVLD